MFPIREQRILADVQIRPSHVGEDVPDNVNNVMLAMAFSRVRRCSHYVNNVPPACVQPGPSHCGEDVPRPTINVILPTSSLKF